MSEDVKEALGAHEVASWLRRHPRFLGQFPDLALSLVVPREDGQATSLASYQLEVLRDKNRDLNRRLHELVGIAQDNEQLTLRTHQLALVLMRCGTAADTLRALVASLIEDFHSDLVRMILFRPIPGWPQVEWLQAIAADDARLAPFAEFRSAGEPLCGRLHKDKLDLLFGVRAAEVQSAALLTIGTRGLLAIGSLETARFFPGMGTLFLRLLAETLDAALARFDD